MGFVSFSLGLCLALQLHCLRISGVPGLVGTQPNPPNPAGPAAHAKKSLSRSCNARTGITNCLACAAPPTKASMLCLMKRSP